MRKFYKIDPRIHFEKLEELIDDPVVVKVNGFDEEDLDKFEDNLDEAHFTGQPVIPILIDSFGGSTYGLQGFIAAIESCRVPVATVLTSKALSAGAILFGFGTNGYRFMHPDATIMIHDVRSHTGGHVEDIKADAQHLDELNRSVYQRLATRLGHDPEYFIRLIKDKAHVDWYLTAKDAKKHRLANHLKVPSFEVEIAMTVKFQ